MDTERKTATVTVKVSPSERELIRWGAQLLGETPSTFAREAATDRAMEAIAGQSIAECDR
jgi:uncharacterized protein (DUF1778 family)